MRNLFFCLPRVIPFLMFASLTNAEHLSEMTCADFSGSYYCSFEETDPQYLDFEQYEENGRLRMVIGNQELIVDGHVHSSPPSEYAYDVEHRANCEGSDLTFWEKGRTYPDGKKYESDFRIKLTRDQNLQGDSRYVVHGSEEGSEETFENEFSCVRQSVDATQSAGLSRGPQ